MKPTFVEEDHHRDRPLLQIMRLKWEKAKEFTRDDTSEG